MIFSKFSSSTAFKTFLVTIGLWIFVVIYVVFYSFEADYRGGNSSCESLLGTVSKLRHRLDEHSDKIEEVLEQINNRPISKAEPSVGYADTGNTLELGHEVIRRRAMRYTRELWYTISADLRKLQATYQTTGQSVPLIDSLRDRVDELTRYLEVDLDGLGRVNQLAQKRIAGLDRLAQLVQRRIHATQNPPDCSQANFLLVSLNRPCAFGCNAHHLSYCFQLAYATNRTLVFTNHDSVYTRWWMQNFEPLSSKCRSPVIDEDVEVPNFLQPTQANKPRFVRCAYIGSVGSNLPWIPPAVPSDIAPELQRYHGAPFVWFMGQLITYLMRPTATFKHTMARLFDSYRLTGPNREPTVGVHVRRTDKINTEASFHDLAEYMVHVGRYYDYLDAEQLMMHRKHEWKDDVFAQRRLRDTLPKRRVYLATDDSSLFKEAAEKYPDYEFVGDPARAETAAVTKRSQLDSVTGVALDILALSKTDYLVCTFSSQVCRVAYELMQVRYADLGDASSRVQSLDDIYYFGGQQASPFETVIGDKRSNLKPGNLVHMAGNHWDGYAKVTPVEQSEARLAPAYKFQASILAVNMSGSPA